MTYPQDGGDGVDVRVAWFVVVPGWVLELDISDGALRLYCVLASYANRDGVSWVGRQALAKRLRVKSEKTVDRHVKELCDADLLRVTARKNADGDQTSNLWTLRMHAPQASDKFVRGGVKNVPTPGVKNVALTRTSNELDRDESDLSRSRGAARSLPDGSEPPPPGPPPLLTARELMERDAASLEADGGVARLEDARAALADAREILKAKGRHPSQLFADTEETP